MVQKTILWIYQKTLFDIVPGLPLFKWLSLGVWRHGYYDRFYVKTIDS